jgi:hypothetical protein
MISLVATSSEVWIFEEMIIKAQINRFDKKMVYDALIAIENLKKQKLMIL